MTSLKHALNHIGQWVYANKYKTLLIWLIIFLGFVLTFAHMGDNYSSSYKISGLPSIEAQNTIKKQFHQNLKKGTMDVVVQTNKRGQINSSAMKNKIHNAISQIKSDKDAEVKSVADPYTNQGISKDKTTADISITFKQNEDTVGQNVVHKVEKTFNPIKSVNNAKVAYSGSVSITPLDIGETSEIIGLVIAFILLLVLFRSFITAGLPIVSALVGLITGVSIVGIGTNYIQIADVAQTLMTMVTLAVGIDYALFIVHRYKGDLSIHDDPKEALGNALANAGSSVLFAGITVIIALCGLSIAGIEFLSIMGFAAALGVVFAVLSALTLLPALVSLAHNHIKPGTFYDPKDDTPHGWFTTSIVKHPISVVIVSLIVLIAFAIPSHHMRLGMPYDGALPKSQTERQSYDMLSDKFGEGTNSPLVGVIKLNPKSSLSQKQSTLNKITKHINKMNGVNNLQIFPDEAVIKKIKSPQYQQQVKLAIKAKVTADMKQAVMKNPKLEMNPQQMKLMEAKLAQQYAAQAKAQATKGAVKDYYINGNQKYAMIQIIPKKGSESVQTSNLANKVSSYSKSLRKSDHTDVTLTGDNAVNIDIAKKLNHATPVFATVVIVLAFILLMVVFKSFVIPIIAMLGFGLSLLASFGVTVGIMQDGFLKGLFGISKGSPIIAFLPVAVIGILFGLAMDYEVFMVSRIREEYVKTHDNTRSVIAGVKGSSPVIITAALIMTAVFGSFIINSNPTIKSFGISLSFGIIFDAFFVRLMIVPAMIKLFGHVNWIFPGQNKKNK
ncbi:MMPL family transporter [Philodulcilactobacillus myokoensis]|uniref:MMPL family transporter n=1 Tax=Philodulcilactobacillus myokoensis TaxID=2929573 RepID=UPI00257109E0|nr:MMPL family transporter [Philodulcilactobacillus myokoensis]